MATKKKLLQAAAGNAGGDALNVEDVFSTYLYDGNWDGGAATTNQIVNGIDLSTEGGLVWIKSRGQSNLTHRLFDSETSSGVTGFYNLSSASYAAAGGPNTSMMSSFNSDGFTVGNNSDVNSGFHAVTDYASWTFRKAPKFFDVVQFSTGGSAVEQTINHSLGSTPGMIIIKCTTNTGSWFVWHRGIGTTQYLRLEATDAVATYDGVINNVTSTSFTTDVGTAVPINSTNIAYLFAHNDGDGEFGPDGDADIIKCGSYTGTSSSDAINQIDLGFEPQWLLIKGADYPTGWQLFDNMRGIVIGGNDARLFADTSGAEGQSGDVDINATGFYPASGSFNTNKQDKTYIYIAIRRGTAVPESATDVFAVTTQSGSTPPAHDTGFVTDFSLRRENALSSASVIQAADRLRGKPYLTTEGTNSETNLNNNTWDFMDGWFGATSNDSNKYAWSWKRAPNYMDVVAYTGTGSTRTVAHNLGAAPEMMWFKGRNQSAYNWMVYHKSISPANGIYLSDGGAAAGASFQFANTAPTATAFTVSSGVDVNSSNEPYIAYLFASLDGISKVGSVTHSGTTNVDCGFSSGARFVLLKRTDATGDWYVWDSVRGIVSGNDPYLLLNSTAAEVTNTDYIDPLSSGFTITSSFTAGDYIFYAIA